jgi:hypothetical protein
LRHHTHERSATFFALMNIHAECGHLRTGESIY